MAKIKPEFDRQNVKVIGLSVDSTGDHEGWAKDIEETQGHAPNYRLSAMLTSRCRSCTGCFRPKVAGRREKKNARRPIMRPCATFTSLAPDKKIKLILVYPDDDRRNFDEVLRVIDSLQLTAKHQVATPVNWKPGEDVIIAGSVSNDEAKSVTQGWKRQSLTFASSAAAVKTLNCAATGSSGCKPRSRAIGHRKIAAARILDARYTSGETPWTFTACRRR